MKRIVIDFTKDKVITAGVALAVGFILGLLI